MRAEALIITEGDWTKPRLAVPEGAPRVFFNVSHSGDYALVALSETAEIGIDIEQIRADCPVDDLARRYYSAREHQLLRKLSAPQRLRDFYRLWTAKEAILKCVGLGLSVPPALVEVCLSDDAEPKVHSFHAEQKSLQLISVRELALAEGYAASIAAESPGPILVNDV